MSLAWLPCDADSLATSASEYARNGWAVFPCRGKHPLNTNGFKGASVDRSQVEGWWESNPTANVAWALAEGLWALDVDPRHGGDASLAALQQKHGPLPHTLRARTGSGGEHWIFRVPAGVTIRQLAGFQPGLDTRLGGRGYLLVAPSVHPETGKRYRWLACVDPIEAPVWLVDMVKAPPPAPVVKYEPPKWQHEQNKRRRYALAALKGCADEVRAAGEGQRNNALNKAWFRMAQLRDAVERSEVEAALLDAALTVGLSETEARKVMR